MDSSAEGKALNKGWMTASPCEHYSSRHEISLAGVCGLSGAWWPKAGFFVETNFNLHTPLNLDPNVYLTFHIQDADKPPSSPRCCFSITQMTRWRMDIQPYATFDDYLNSLIRWHRCNYKKSEKKFREYGCTIELIEADWTAHAARIYQLYLNVAKRHGDIIFDQHFFEAVAQRRDYKLICVWFEGEIIGMSLLQAEHSTLHCVVFGFDYHHSSKSYTYSWLNYEHIRLAIAEKKYRNIDVGLTADESKTLIGFVPVASRMDVYTNGKVTYWVLKAISLLISATFTSESKLKFGFAKIFR